jgi:hypothetical protein
MPQASTDHPGFDDSLSNKLKGNFLKRLIEFYKQDWRAQAQGGPEPVRRLPRRHWIHPHFPARIGTMAVRL